MASSSGSFGGIGFRRRKFRSKRLSTTSPSSFTISIPLEVWSSFDLVHSRSLLRKVDEGLPHFRTIVALPLADNGVVHTRTFITRDTGFDLVHARNIYPPGTVVLFDEDIHRPVGRAELVL